MSLFGTCELKNLTAEYVEERMAMEAAEVSTIDDLNINETDVVDEAAYVDMLLEALD